MEVPKKIILMFRRLAKENKAERETSTIHNETINSLLMLRTFINDENLDVDNLTILNQKHGNNTIERGDALIAMMEIMSDPAKAALKASEDNKKLQTVIQELRQQIASLTDSPSPDDSKPARRLKVLHRVLAMKFWPTDDSMSPEELEERATELWGKNWKAEAAKFGGYRDMDSYVINSRGKHHYKVPDIFKVLRLIHKEDLKGL